MSKLIKAYNVSLGNRDREGVGKRLAGFSRKLFLSMKHIKHISLATKYKLRIFADSKLRIVARLIDAFRSS